MSEDLPLEIGVHDRGADTVAAVVGELDFGTTPRMLKTVEPLAAQGRTLVLDLSGLDFCDSSALSALVRLHKVAQAAGGALHLAALRPQVRSAITLTSLDQLLTIHPQVPDALGGPGR
ncbi:STAS domain-containing protein [Lentzea sp.]|uniref:STAS domain-containing protein n=1 Tax=Lentzea sp. TaxID=56099 RepID=UPI002BB14E43|nr:STAS domain-containing protein [Lentzea sp.]HUQ59480.1 STAS domain-containing protein [Lentzea sp.]